MNIEYRSATFTRDEWVIIELALLGEGSYRRTNAHTEYEVMTGVSMLELAETLRVMRQHFDQDAWSN